MDRLEETGLGSSCFQTLKYIFFSLSFSKTFPFCYFQIVVYFDELVAPYKVLCGATMLEVLEYWSMIGQVKQHFTIVIGCNGSDMMLFMHIIRVSTKAALRYFILLVYTCTNISPSTKYFRWTGNSFGTVC